MLQHSDWEGGLFIINVLLTFFFQQEALCSLIYIIYFLILICRITIQMEVKVILNNSIGLFSFIYSFI